MIEVYGTEICSYCNAAKSLLEREGLFYKFYLVGSDLSADDLKQKFPGKTKVPIIVVDGRVLHDGYSSLRTEIKEIVAATKLGFGDGAI